MANPDIIRELRLREKLLTSGVSSLSDIELLAVFISSGSAGKSCYQLAEALMTRFGDLRGVLNTDFDLFSSISGLGKVKFTQLQAAREICARNDFIQLKKTISVTNTQETSVYLKRQLRDRKNEIVAALFLDSQYRILAYEELFSGTINTATIHLRPIVDRVLKLNAAALILAHNHPSGVSEASAQDKCVTARLSEALALIDAKLVDHLIIGDNEIYSIMNTVKWICH